VSTFVSAARPGNEKHTAARSSKKNRVRMSINV
jgi:hypothetical protein